MNPEWLTAAGTLGTFLVIATSAVAAFVQLRHVRSSNQIMVVMEMRKLVESPEFRQAQHFVTQELPKRLNDPVERAQLAREWSHFEGDYEAIRLVGNYLESLGGMVKNRLLDRTVAFDYLGLVAVRNWNSLAPVVAFIREKAGDQGVWENFEYVTALFERMFKERPSTYPRNTPRMPEDRSLIEALQKD